MNAIFIYGTGGYWATTNSAPFGSGNPAQLQVSTAAAVGAVPVFGLSGQLGYASGAGTQSSPWVLSVSVTSITGPIATTSTLGIVQVPASGGLAIDGSGNVTVNVDGTTVTVNGSNQLAIPTATTGALGVAKFPAAGGLGVTAGSVSVTVDGSTVGVNGSNQLAIIAPFPTIVSGSGTGATGSVSSIATITPTAAGSYRVGGNINVTAISGGTVTLEVTYTDEASNAQTKSFFQQGTTTAAISTQIDSIFPPMDIRIAANTAITILTVVTGTITYDYYATIQQVM